MANEFENSGEVKVAEFVKLDGDQVRRHVDELVRSSVEETLNATLGTEADELCKARRPTIFWG